MAIMSREITGAELANELAYKLSDLEFELLVRARIKNSFAEALRRDPNLSESYNTVTFLFGVSDDSMWTVAMGQNYRTSKSCTGQVLSATFDDVMQSLGMQERNKLSLLIGCSTKASPDGATLDVNAADNNDDVPF